MLTSKSTNSILRQNKKEEVENFSFKAVEEEWKQHAPTFHRFIETASTNPTSEKRNIDKKGDALLPAKVSAGCKLLSIYNRDMSAMKYVNDVILSKGGLKTSAFTRMQSTGDCHSYPTVIKKADETAELWDSELRQWQTKCHNDQELEEQIIQQISYISDTIELVQNQQNLDEMKELVLEKAKLGNTLCKFRQKMHPSYYFIGDNCDMVTKVRRMTSKNQHKDEHMFQMCAYLNRISGNDKDNSKPLQNANEANFSQLIPGEEEKQDLLNQFAMLVARKWTVYIPHFRPYETVIPPYIDHGFMKETKKKTERVR